MSLREELLAIDTLKRETIDVPEWNKSVVIAQMDARRNFQYVKALGDFDADDSASRNALLVVFSVENLSDKNLLFQPEDVPVLVKQSSKMINRIVTSIVKLYPDIDDTKKNSVTALS